MKKGLEGKVTMEINGKGTRRKGNEGDAWRMN